MLECFRSNTVYQGSPFRPSSMDELVEIAALVDPLDLSVEDKFAFATCPLDRRDHGTDQRLLRYAKAHARGEVAEVPETFGGSFLEAHEATVRAMSSYLWLARRFPETFARVEEATARRSAANEAIETHLRETAVRRAQHVDEADAGLVPAR